jgi:hypothetical protein
MWKWFIFSIWYIKNIPSLHFCNIIDELKSIPQNISFRANITTKTKQNNSIML